MELQTGEVTLQIHCRDLPGTTFGEHTAVRLGTQRGQVVVDDVPANTAGEVTFTLPLSVRPRPATEELDFGGPFVHGKPGERFLYLCWGQRGADGTWYGFRRAKIPLALLDRGRLLNALHTTRPLSLAIRMTDAKGGPICGSLKSKDIEQEE